jgi:hypothetical protein
VKVQVPESKPIVDAHKRKDLVAPPSGVRVASAYLSKN